MISVTGVLAARAATAAEQLAAALAVPPTLEGDTSPSSPRWRAQSLSTGAAGVALLHAARARCGLSGWDQAHAWLAAACREPLVSAHGAGLWYGAGALAHAVSLAVPPKTYVQARHRLNEAVAALVDTRLEAAAERMATSRRPFRGEFDLARGLAGLGAHLLHQNPHGRQLRQILAYLVRLVEPIRADDEAGVSVPGWWTLEEPNGMPPGASAGGYADLGMAHGIAGVLALLALAARRRITVPGQYAAIAGICRWLDVWQQESLTGPWWPERVTLAEHRARVRRSSPTRPSWCYGTPGIARAVQLAGHTLGDPSRSRLAEHAVLGCLSDADRLTLLTDPALCHGWAGLVAVCWQMGIDASTSDIGNHLPVLLDTLISRVDDLPPGGLIEGSAGVALLLHTVTAPSISWETCLLIN